MVGAEQAGEARLLAQGLAQSGHSVMGGGLAALECAVRDGYKGKGEPSPGGRGDTGIKAFVLCVF